MKTVKLGKIIKKYGGMWRELGGKRKAEHIRPRSSVLLAT